jgi:hypothetical protein
MPSTIDKEALRRRFETEPDFINVKRFGYSLKRCQEKYPDGLPDDRAVAAAACLDESDVEVEMDRITEELKDILDIEEP